MKRRAFLLLASALPGAPLAAAIRLPAPLPTGQLPSATVAQPYITVHLNGETVSSREFIDRVVIPAIRDAVNNDDAVIIGPNSRQARDLERAQ